MDSQSAALVLANLCGVVAENNRRHASVSSARWTVCLYCSRSLPESQLYEHVAAHIGHQPLTCCYCLAEFTARAALVTHTADQHPGCPLRYDEDRSDYKQMLVDKIVSDCLRGGWVPKAGPPFSQNQHAPAWTRMIALQTAGEAGSSSDRYSTTLTECQPSPTESNESGPPGKKATGSNETQSGTPVKIPTRSKSSTPVKKTRKERLISIEKEVEMFETSILGGKRPDVMAVAKPTPAQVAARLNNSPRLPMTHGSLFYGNAYPSGSRRKIPKLAPVAKPDPSPNEQILNQRKPDPSANEQILNQQKPGPTPSRKLFNQPSVASSSAVSGKARSLPGTPKKADVTHQKTALSTSSTPRKQESAKLRSLRSNSVDRWSAPTQVLVKWKGSMVSVACRRSARVPSTTEIPNVDYDVHKVHKYATKLSMENYGTTTKESGQQVASRGSDRLTTTPVGKGEVKPILASLRSSKRESPTINSKMGVFTTAASHSGLKGGPAKPKFSPRRSVGDKPIVLKISDIAKRMDLRVPKLAKVTQGTRKGPTSWKPGKSVVKPPSVTLTKPEKSVGKPSKESTSTKPGKPVDVSLNAPIVADAKNQKTAAGPNLVERGSNKQVSASESPHEEARGITTRRGTSLTPGSNRGRKRRGDQAESSPPEKKLTLVKVGGNVVQVSGKATQSDTALKKEKVCECPEPPAV